MKKIITTVIGSALIALSVANAASAAERQQTRRSAQQQQTIGGIVDPRDSYAEFGAPRGNGYGYGSSYGGYDGRVYGGAISAPAGR